VIKTLTTYIKHRISPPSDKNAVEAYNLWAANYDSQPGNLMLDLDELLFSKMLGTMNLENKQVADIGCGTGRHWPKIFKKNPASLTGFDVSPGMLEKLKDKFPEANTRVIADDLFSNIKDSTYDVIISTLTVAHIEYIDDALLAWCRILKEDGEIIITDFHPDMLALGGKRTFSYQNNRVSVRNFVHTTALIRQILLKKNFQLVYVEELKVDESVKHHYLSQNALPVYEKFKGFPVIYGMHFRRAR
jgi:ubiquinone/menaquinone biosynthesis C-methylase UbiE